MHYSCIFENVYIDDKTFSNVFDMNIENLAKPLMKNGNPNLMSNTSIRIPNN